MKIGMANNSCIPINRDPGHLFITHDSKRLFNYLRQLLNLSPSLNFTTFVIIDFVMNKKECPSCAMDIDNKSKVCPICGYEFAEFSVLTKWVAILLVILFLLFMIF